MMRMAMKIIVKKVNFPINCVIMFLQFSLLFSESSKRAITYEMAKNKGLTPHRKKEQRNPRVKHRMKYRKAVIRRKGAVRKYSLFYFSSLYNFLFFRCENQGKSSVGMVGRYRVSKRTYLGVLKLSPDSNDIKFFLNKN